MADPSLYEILRDHIERDESAHERILGAQTEILRGQARMEECIRDVRLLARSADDRSQKNESRLDHIDGRDKFVKWALGALIALAAALGLDKLFFGR